MNFNTNLDVNKIFFQNNISEIEGINREIQHEIEKKREELRTMVRCKKLFFKNIEICQLVQRCLLGWRKLS